MIRTSLRKLSLAAQAMHWLPLLLPAWQPKARAGSCIIYATC
jgi:hypothetical protein